MFVLIKVEIECWKNIGHTEEIWSFQRPFERIFAAQNPIGFINFKGAYIERKTSGHKPLSRVPLGIEIKDLAVVIGWPNAPKEATMAEWVARTITGARRHVKNMAFISADIRAINLAGFFSSLDNEGPVRYCRWTL